VDADTGESERIPAEWFDADDKWPSAEISGDGSLVSAYSESGPQESPMVVTLYDWKTKKQVAKQMHGFPAGGAAGGGVTEDGKIEFTYDRSGSDIVDPSTGRALLSAPIDSVRSPDGAWNVDFPATTYTDPGNEITIRHGDDGRAAGKLDIPVTEEQAGVPWPGAFCGNTGKFVTAIGDTVYVFRIPSGRKIETFAAESWRDPSAQDFPMTSLACSIDGKRLAIGSGARLTVRNLK
jgi:hypothetical protein